MKSDPSNRRGSTDVDPLAAGVLALRWLRATQLRPRRTEQPTEPPRVRKTTSADPT